MFLEDKFLHLALIRKEPDHSALFPTLESQGHDCRQQNRPTYHAGLPLQMVGPHAVASASAFTPQRQVVTQVQ